MILVNGHHLNTRKPLVYPYNAYVIEGYDLNIPIRGQAHDKINLEMAKFDQNKQPFCGANLEGHFVINMSYGDVLTYLEFLKDFSTVIGQKGSIMKLSSPSNPATQLQPLHKVPYLSESNSPI